MMRSEAHAEDVSRISAMDYPWDRLSGTKVLVTGATGMLGMLLTDVLESKSREHRFDLIAMSRNASELERLFPSDNPRLGRVAHDVNIPLDAGGYDSVFHLASNTHPHLYQSDPVGTIATNVLGLKNLLDAMDPGEGRFLFASSVEVYGQNRGDTERFDEGYCGYIDCNTVRAGYNESKRVGEALCQAYGSSKGMDFIIPRLSRLYGPSLRTDDTKALSQFIMKAAKGEDIVLKSKGDQCFSYCYSADAVDGMLHLFFNGKRGEAYNVSGPPDSDITLRELASKLADVAGSKVVFQVPDEAEARGYSPATLALMDTSKIRSTGWAPCIGIDEGLRRTVSSLAQALRRDRGRSRTV